MDVHNTDPGAPPALLDADSDPPPPLELDLDNSALAGPSALRTTLIHGTPAEAAKAVDADADEPSPISATPSIEALVQRTRAEREAHKASSVDSAVHDVRPPERHAAAPQLESDDARTSPIPGRGTTRTDAPVAGTHRPPPPAQRSRSALPLLAFALFGAGALFLVGRAIRHSDTYESASHSASQPAPLSDGLAPAAAPPSPPADPVGTPASGNTAAGAQGTGVLDADAVAAAEPPKATQPASVRRPLSGPSSTEEASSLPKQRSGALPSRPAPDPEPEAPPEPAPPPAEFNANAAGLALETAATRASSCRKKDDPSGMATVTITFAPSGRVTTATVSGPPFAGTETGGCIASTMRDARVPPFVGDLMTVRKTVTIY